MGASLGPDEASFGRTPASISSQLGIGSRPLPAPTTAMQIGARRAPGPRQLEVRLPAWGWGRPSGPGVRFPGPGAGAPLSLVRLSPPPPPDKGRCQDPGSRPQSSAGQEARGSGPAHPPTCPLLAGPTLPGTPARSAGAPPPLRKEGGSVRSAQGAGGLRPAPRLARGVGWGGVRAHGAQPVSAGGPE